MFGMDRYRKAELCSIANLFCGLRVNQFDFSSGNDFPESYRKNEEETRWVWWLVLSESAINRVQNTGKCLFILHTIAVVREAKECAKLSDVYTLQITLLPYYSHCRAFALDMIRTISPLSLALQWSIEKILGEFFYSCRNEALRMFPQFSSCFDELLIFVPSENDVLAVFFSQAVRLVPKIEFTYACTEVTEEDLEFMENLRSRLVFSRNVNAVVTKRTEKDGNVTFSIVVTKR